MEHCCFGHFIIITFFEYILLKYLRPGLEVSFSHKHMYAISRLEILRITKLQNFEGGLAVLKSQRDLVFTLCQG